MRISATQPDSTTFGESLTGVPTETITMGTNLDANQSAKIGGTITAGDVLSISVFDARLTAVPQVVSCTVKSGDSVNSVALGLYQAFGKNTALANINLSAGLNANVVSFSSAGYNSAPNSTTYTPSVSGTPTETLSFGSDQNGNVAVTVGGTPTTGNVLSITVYNANLSGGQKSETYTVTGTNTLTTIATALTSAISGDVSLQAIGVGATSTGAVISITTTGSSYTSSTSGGATETITLGTNNAGNITATIGGKPTTSDTLTITTHNDPVFILSVTNLLCSKDSVTRCMLTSPESVRSEIYAQSAQ